MMRVVFFFLTKKSINSRATREEFVTFARFSYHFGFLYCWLPTANAYATRVTRLFLDDSNSIVASSVPVVEILLRATEDLQLFWWLTSNDCEKWRELSWCPAWTNLPSTTLMSCCSSFWLKLSTNAGFPMIEFKHSHWNRIQVLRTVLIGQN